VKARRFKTTVLIAVILTAAQTAMANSVQGLVQQGNKLYNKGNFNDALKEYDKALLGQPQALEPKFNQANCYFQLDDLGRAMDLYNEVAAESKNMELVEKAKYNLGNCYFHRGSKQKDSNLQKALEDLQTGIVCWRSALEINPENEKAAENIEVARLIIKDIIDRINKQKQEQQQQAEKQKQLQGQLKELTKQQKALAQKTQQTMEEAKKGQINRQQAENSFKQQARAQSQLKAKTEQTLQQIQQQETDKPLSQQIQQAGSELEQAVDAQSNAETQLEVSEPNAAKKYEDKAVEHLENALRQLSENNQSAQEQQQERQEQAQQPREPNQPDQQQQQQQQAAAMSDTIAQEILDREQREKKQRQILQRSGYQKVEKDW